MSDQRLTMSLEEIVKMEDGGKNRKNNRNNTSLNARGNQNNNRNQRKPAPYSDKTPNSNARKPTQFRHEQVALKFLLPHHFAGSLIGNGGESIKKLMELTGADIHVSNSTDHYPGTDERVVYITGSDKEVSLAQSFIWEMIGQQTGGRVGDEYAPQWNPLLASKQPGRYDRYEVSGRITVPAGAAGAVMGKAGSTIQRMGAETGVNIAMNSKEEGELTNERVVTMSGILSGCMNCTALVLRKLAEEEHGYNYYVKGTTYPKAIAQGVQGAHGAHGGRFQNNNKHFSHDDSERDNQRVITHRNRAPSYDDNDRGVMHKAPQHGRQITLSGGDKHHAPHHLGAISYGSSNGGVAETLSANTIIELGVPDALIGGIVGVQGSTLADIISLSGANVIVSKRGTYVEGSNNRLVTITGSPASAQTAHTLIVHKLKEFK